MDKFARIDTNKIYSPFLDKCILLVENCEKRGVSIWAISGYRSPEEQDALYNQGRGDKSKPLVTNAKAFQSFHNFGLAIDFCVDKDANKEGLQPNWDLAPYRILREEAEKLGLVSGLSFKSFPEGPHIQFTVPKSLLEMKQAHEKGGLENVWNLIES